MQIVIDIPKDAYNYIKANGARIPYYKLTDAIKNGTPLPKGHGRLIDADALWRKWVFDAVGKQEIDNAPTIIDADPESEDEVMTKEIEQLLDTKFKDELKIIIAKRLDEINHFIAGCDSPFSYAQIREAQELMCEIRSTLEIEVEE